MSLSLVPIGNRLIAMDALHRDVGDIRINGLKCSVFANHEFDDDFSDLLRAGGRLEVLLSYVEPVGTESPNGTRGDTVTDSSLSVWTLGANGETLRNGAWLNGGIATEYQYIDGVVQALSLSNGHWMSFVSGIWVDNGPADPSPPADSADGFVVPTDGPSITLNAKVYTLGGSFGISVLENGVFFHDGGYANQLKLWKGVLYALQPGDLNYYFFDEVITNIWQSIGTTAPANITSADGTTITAGAGSIFISGDVWTISGTTILKNAAQYADGGPADQLKLFGAELYHHRPSDDHWYHGDGAPWIDDGTLEPGTDSPNATIVPTTAASITFGGNVYTLSSGVPKEDGVTWYDGVASDRIKLNSGTLYLRRTSDSHWIHRAADGLSWVDDGLNEPGATTINVALSANGGVATASSTYSADYLPATANNGIRTGAGFGSGGGWNDGTISSFPDWLEIAFSGLNTIGEIDVFTIPDNFPVEPTLETTCVSNGITAFVLQYWNGTAWIDIPGTSVTGNDKAWRQFVFSPISTSKVRVYITGSAGNYYSRIVELEAWGVAGVADVVAPTVPAGLGSTVLSSSVTLSWTASTDNVGVSGYKVYRDTVHVGSSASTSFTDTSLSPSTAYSYKVLAYDAAGNESAQSSAHVANTSAAPSTTPFLTTGSIAAGSNLLTVANPDLFPINSWAMIAAGQVGGTGNGSGLRGKIDVGGSWPSVVAADNTALQATTVTNGRYIGRGDIGATYQGISGAWAIVPANEHYYKAKIVPRAYHAQVLAKSGNVMTMGGGPTNGIAKVGVSNVNVLYDQGPVWNAAVAALGPNQTLNANTFFGPGVTSAPIGCCIKVHNKTGPILTCDTRGSFEFYSPKGAPNLQWEFYNCTNVRYSKLRYRGNIADNGFGLNWRGSGYAGGLDGIGGVGDVRCVTDDQFPTDGTSFTRGCHLLSCSASSTAIDAVADADFHEYMFLTPGSDSGLRIVFRNTLSRVSTFHKQYVNWAVSHVWPNDCWGYDNRVECPDGLVAGFEFFLSNNPANSGGFVRPTGLNASMAANSCGGFTYGADPVAWNAAATLAAKLAVPGGELRFTENCLATFFTYPIGSQLLPIAVYIGTSSSGYTYLARTGSAVYVRNLRTIFEGYATLAGNAAGAFRQLTALQVRPDNLNVSVDGAVISGMPSLYPTYSQSYGVRGIIHGGDSPQVRNCRVTGQAANQNEWWNILVRLGNSSNMSNNVAEPGSIQTGW